MIPKMIWSHDGHPNMWQAFVHANINAFSMHHAVNCQQPTIMNYFVVTAPVSLRQNNSKPESIQRTAGRQRNAFVCFAWVSFWIIIYSLHICPRQRLGIRGCFSNLFRQFTRSSRELAGGSLRRLHEHPKTSRASSSFTSLLLLHEHPTTSRTYIYICCILGQGRMVLLRLPII